MPITPHVSNICVLFNEQQSYLNLGPSSQPLKIAQTYDLLAACCGLEKYDFQRIGFLSTSIMLEVDTYHPCYDKVITSTLSAAIHKKTALDDKFYNDRLAHVFAQMAFHSNGKKLRHPDQILAILEDLYEDAALTWENIDSVIDFINNIEFSLLKKKPIFDNRIYLILHWCYAILKVHEAEIYRLCHDAKIAAKRQLLISLYKPYIDNAVAKSEQWFNCAIQAKVPAALDLKQLIEQYPFTESPYEISHPFLINSFELGKTRKSLDVSLFKRHGWTPHEQNPFEQILSKLYLEASSDLEFATLAFLYRFFKRDMLGLSYGDQNDLINEDNYKMLYSKNFMDRLLEEYPALIQSDINAADTRAQRLFNDMFQHYLKVGNFSAYKTPNLVH